MQIALPIKQKLKQFPVKIRRKCLFSLDFKAYYLLFFKFNTLNQPFSYFTIIPYSATLQLYFTN